MACYAVGMVLLSLGAYASIKPIAPTMDFSAEHLWGQVPQYGLTDTPSSDRSYWCYPGEFGNQSVIRDYLEGDEQAGRYRGFSPLVNPQPPYMSDGVTNQGFLAFGGDYPLMRSFKPIVDETGRSSMVVAPEENDLFVDALVQFQPRHYGAGDVPSVDVMGKAKFMCWLSAPKDGPTNFVITAGRYDASGLLYRTNYVTTAKVSTNQWYRLTARMISSASTSDVRSESGMVLYLDGNEVVCAEGDYAIGDDAAAMADLFAGNAHYRRRGLFPVIRKVAGQVPGLYGIAMHGLGAIDEIAAVDSGNPLARPTEKLMLAVASDSTKVTNVTCSVFKSGVASPYFVTNFTGLAEFLVGPKDRIEVAALTSSRYSIHSELVLVGNQSAYDADATSGHRIVMAEEFASDDALVARINTGNANYRVGDRLFETFNDAVEAAFDEGGTLVVANDVELDADSANGQLRVLPEYGITLDLNGKRIKGDNDLDEAAIYNQGRLEVIDSVGGGVIEAKGMAIETVSDNDALEVNHDYAVLTMGSETVTNNFTVKGRVRVTRGELRLMVGTYLTPPDESPDTFYLEQHLMPERFSAYRLPDTPEGVYWQIGYDGRRQVRFMVANGTVTPVYTNVEHGATIEWPVVDVPGYTVTNWQVEATGELWDFSRGVTESMTLVGMEKTDIYTVTYDAAVPASAPTEYTVLAPKTMLPDASSMRKAHFTFDGWRDAASGKGVDAVGKGATFIGSSEVVHGDLDLRSQWIPEFIRWTNVYDGHSESNGTYYGSWSFVVPVRPAEGLTIGAKVAIDEIDFCIVNPLLYPKTAEYLAVTPAAGAAVVSKIREYGFDEVTSEYLVGTNRLENGRAKVRYAFEGLVVEVGKTNSVCFSSTAATKTQTGGFLRFMFNPGNDDPMFGNCSEAGGTLTPRCSRYMDYCPAYEVTGHLVEKEENE